MLQIYKEKNGDRLFAIINGEFLELESISVGPVDSEGDEIKHLSKKKQSKIKPRSSYWKREVEIKESDLKGHEDEVAGGGMTEKPKTSGSWSRKYDCCQSCGRTDRAHQSKGLCFTCAHKKRKKQSSEVAEERDEKRGTLRQWRCTDCYHDFESTLDKLDIYCLKCGDIHCVQV